jgi:hypothetical protein
MIKSLVYKLFAAAALCGVVAPAFAVNVSIDPAATWLGYMNVSELPSNGGGFVFGSPWGTADLRATFSGPQLTLLPNTIGDTNEFWYQGVGTNPGGPGAPGNKTMEANMYVEVNDTLAGTNVVFSGNVLSNTLVSPYTVVAFIKDFAPDYSSFFQSVVPLTSPGAFSVSLDTVFDFGRHVQYGFAMTGPNVWVTDAPAKGSITVSSAVTPTFNPGDFSGDGKVDGADLSLLLANWGSTVPPTPAAWTGSAPTATGIDADELSRLLANWGFGTSTAIPEPTAAVLGLLALAGVASTRTRS